MYNEEIKTAFLNEKAKTIAEANSYLVIFKSTDEYETKYNTDLCNMDFNQYEEMLKCVGGVRKGYNDLIINHINHYKLWCSTHGMSVSDIDLRTIQFGEDKFKKHMLISPAHLENALDEMFDKVEDKTNDSVIRAAIWLMYSGVRPREIKNIKKSDIDLNTMWIYHNDRKYPIYRQAAECFHFCKTTNEFVYNHPKYNSVYKDRFSSNLLLSSTKGVMSDVTLNTAIGRRKNKIKNSGNELKIDINSEHTWLSGVFFRARETEQITKIEENFTSCAEELMMERTDGKGYSIGKNKIESVINKKARAIKESYMMWKNLINN